MRDTAQQVILDSKLSVGMAGTATTAAAGHYIEHQAFIDTVLGYVSLTVGVLTGIYMMTNIILNRIKIKEAKARKDK